MLVISIFIYFNVNGENSIDNEVQKRSFLMGLSMFPYAYNSKAIEVTRNIVADNADAVTIPIENGVPWEESQTNTPFYNAVQKQIDSIASNIPPNKEVILTVSPFNDEKTAIANDWNLSGNEPRSGDFANVKFSDDKVITAYTNYLTALIKKTNASIIVFAPEVNIFLEKSPKLWPDFKIFCTKVYKNIKKEFPDKKAAFTIQIDEYNLHEQKQSAKLKKIIASTDYIAVKLHPFAYSKYKTPDSLPADYFTRVRKLSPSKPYGIADTAYIAENLNTSKIKAIGSDKIQLEYLTYVFQYAMQQDAKFICWSINWDYDELWDIMKENSNDDVFKTWKDTGLFDGSGNNRLSFNLWHRFFQKKLIR